MSQAAVHQLADGLRRTVEAYRLDALPDGELLDRFRCATDPAAFEAIVRRYGDRVLAACHKVLSDRADVDDVFQVTFLVLLRQAATIRRGQSLGGWLYGVAHRTALQARARASRRTAAEARQPTRMGGASPDLGWREACAILHEEVDRLPDKYRLPLVLCYLDGRTRDEAARQLGVKVDVLRGRLERGRDRLRGRLTKRGVTLSSGLFGFVAHPPVVGGPSESLLGATLEAATGGRVSVGVAALLRGAAPPAASAKLKLAALVLVAGLIAGGVGLKMQGAEPPTKDNGVLSARPAKEAAPSAPDPAKAPDGEKPVAVSGKVVGPDGKPVSKAKLFVFDSEEARPAPQTETNPDGTFAFELPALAGGRSYRYVVASAPSLGLGCDWVGVAVAAEPLKDAVLRLPKDDPIRGRLLDLEGKAVAGAVVRVTDLETGQDDTLNEFVRLWAQGGEGRQQALGSLLGKRLYAKKATAAFFTATTDADGKFTLPGIGRDRCPQLEVRAKGKASQVCLVVIHPDFKPAGGITGSRVFGPEFTLPLAPAKPVSGVVRDADKKPLAGIRVLGQADVTDEPPSGVLLLPEAETVTDAQGRYTLDGLSKANKYALLADPKAGSGLTHAFATLADDGPGFAPLTADFELPRGVVVTGRVTEKRGGKPVRCHLFYRPLASNKWVEGHKGYDGPGIGPWYSEAHTWTDADGRFRLTAVPGPGVLHVQVLDHSREGEFCVAKLAPADDVEEVISKAFGELKIFNTTGQGGGFGPTSLHAYRILRIPADAKEFTADATVDRGVPRVVKLVDPDGKPLAGAWVMNDRVFGPSQKPLPGSEFTAHALDPDAPRPLYAQHDGKQLAGILSLDGKETGPVVFKLQPTATVTGRVLDKDGLPVKEAHVRASYDGGDLAILLNTRARYAGDPPVVTDAEGKFTLPNVAPGMKVRVSVQSKGGAFLGYSAKQHTLKAGETLDLGDWKPK